jgi:hypothetical protein
LPPGWQLLRVAALLGMMPGNQQRQAPLQNERFPPK